MSLLPLPEAPATTQQAPATFLQQLLGKLKPETPADLSIITWPPGVPLTGREDLPAWLTCGVITMAILNGENKVTTFLPLGTLAIDGILLNQDIRAPNHAIQECRKVCTI